MWMYSVCFHLGILDLNRLLQRHPGVRHLKRAQSGLLSSFDSFRTPRLRIAFGLKKLNCQSGAMKNPHEDTDSVEPPPASRFSRKPLCLRPDFKSFDAADATLETVKSLEFQGQEPAIMFDIDNTLAYTGGRGVDGTRAPSPQRKRRFLSWFLSKVMARDFMWLSAMGIR